MVVQKSTKQK